MNSTIQVVGTNTRSAFIARTYAHLLGAIALFVGIEAWLFSSGLALSIAKALTGTSWLLVLGGFVLVSWLATAAANSLQSRAAQYAGLVLYTVAEAVIFVPLLFVAAVKAPGSIQLAAMVTLGGFTVLTAIVFITRHDFSFLRASLMWGGIAALGLIVCSVLFGFNLGPLFSVAMIAFAGIAVLYETSKVLHHYDEGRYVAAALQLFAAIALMLWYVLRLVSSRD